MPEVLSVIVIAVAIATVLVYKFVRQKISDYIDKNRSRTQAEQYARMRRDTPPERSRVPVVRPKATVNYAAILKQPSIPPYQVETTLVAPPKPRVINSKAVSRTNSKQAQSVPQKSYAQFRERTFKAPPQLRIKFTDREGTRTKRLINVQRYSWTLSPQDGGIWAFCHLRKSNRPFAFKQITQAIDAETGEVIADLPSYLEDLYEKTPSYAAELLLETYSCDAYILFCLARLDGAIRANERKIIEDYFAQFGLSDEAIEELVKTLREWSIGSAQQFYNAVRKADLIIRDTVTLQDLTDACVSIVQLHPNKTDTELRWLTNSSKEWDTCIPDDLKYRGSAQKR